MNRFKRFVMNGLLITLMSLIMRAVSVSFNIYISNKIGAVAMGVFTLVSTVYGFALTVATSGISIAATRHIAEALGEEHFADDKKVKSTSIRRIVGKCVTYSLFFSLGTAVALYLLAPYLGIKILLVATKLEFSFSVAEIDVATTSLTLA
jgi:stage V sporulation protein B